MSNERISIIAIIVILIALVASSLYTVQEAQNGIILRLGKIVSTKDNSAFIAKPGLHWKIPLIDQIVYFDMKLQIVDATSDKVYIQEEKYFFVDYYIQWKITNLPVFYTSTGGDIEKAKKLMQQPINMIVRDTFGKRSFKQMVSQDRNTIIAALKAQPVDPFIKYGITVTDVRIKKIDLAENIRVSVFASMRAGRAMVANNYRSNGKRLAEQIRAKADADRITIIATAERNANILRAKGSAEASQIYGDAYANDPEFYSFYRSINAYKNVFSNNNDILVLRPDGDFFKYFNNLGGKASPLTASTTASTSKH